MMNAWQVQGMIDGKMQAGRRTAVALAAVAAALAVTLTGCATGGGAGTQTPVSPALTVVQGRLMGGQQPVAGATMQLYAPNTSTPFGASTPLLTSTVMTDSGGGFDITGKYPCPAANPSVSVYLVATGGNPGIATGTVNNTHLALMAALGPCNTLPLNYPVIQINELTTVAAAYALGGFMADTTHVGASANNATGLANAFLTAGNLANVAGGTIPGALPATSTAPLAEINTLADIIAACVNTDGTGSACSGLLTQTTPPGGTAPVDTIGALISIARHPANNVSTLYGMAASKSPYQPTLASTPNDWTMMVTATGGGLNAPTGLAIDASGSVWVANSAGNAVTKLSNLQAQTSGATGYNQVGALGPQGIAIDTAGNAWVANSSAGSVLELSTAGTALSPTGGYKLAGISSPQAIAIDANNNVWVTNFNANTVSGLNGVNVPATAIAGSPFTAGGTISLPTGVAIDASNNVWISSSGNAVVAELSNAGATLSGSGFSDGVIQEPTGIAIDAAGHTYVADNALTTLSVFGASGAAATPVTGSGLAQPLGLATDGANAVYATDSGAVGAISVITALGATPLKLGTLNTPVGLAVDESGNVWTANSGDNSVSEFIGLATPVRTPLALRFGAF